MSTEERAAREQLRAERRRRKPREPHGPLESHGPHARRGRDNVVSCRLDSETLEAVDTLVEAGVRATRADAVAWLIRVGLEANRDLVDELTDTVEQIRRLRRDAASKARRRAGEWDDDTEPTESDSMG